MLIDNSTNREDAIIHPNEPTQVIFLKRSAFEFVESFINISHNRKNDFDYYLNKLCAKICNLLKSKIVYYEPETIIKAYTNNDELIKIKISSYIDDPKVTIQYYCNKNNISLQKTYDQDITIEEIAIDFVNNIKNNNNPIVLNNYIPDMNAHKQSFNASIFSEINVIYSCSKGTVYRPLTKNAANFLSCNTNWRFDYDDNYFDSIKSSGPIYMLFLSNNTKYTFQIGSFFMSEDNNPVDIAEFKQKHKWVFSIPSIKNTAIALSNVKSDISNIFLYLLNPDKNIIIKAIKSDYTLFPYIKNPSEKVQIIAVDLNPYVITYIKSPIENIQLAAVQQNMGSIYYIENPSEAVQLVSVQQNIGSIYCIKSAPCEAAIKLHNKLYPDDPYTK